LNDADGVN